MKIYLDTSAFVKRYCEEEGSEIVNEIFESGKEIVTSYWTLAEATAAIDKKVTKRQISAEERDFVLSFLLSDVFDRNIILTHHISADDALQLFSCIVSLSPIFLASDKALVRAAKREGLKAFDAENSEERERMRRLLV